MTGDLTFIPTGGLGNRMHTIASAIALARQVGSRLHIYWFQDWGLWAPFAHLFRPIELEEVSLTDAGGAMRALYDRPRRKNLHLPRVYQRLAFDSCIYENNAELLRQQQFDFAAWAQGRRVYMASFSDFFPYAPSLLGRCFVPVSQVAHDIDERCAPFRGQPAVGVHIRRADHVTAIALSPTHLFVERMDQILDARPDTMFYLATDSEAVKQELRDRYGRRLLTSPQPADRNSAAGIRQAVVEMYTLAHTDLILGSCRSTFSELASQLSGARLEVVKK